MLIDRGLVRETSNEIGGVRRLYDIGKGYYLSAINAPAAHLYPFAWEIAVIYNHQVVYDTPLTSYVEVFDTDDEASAFIERAFVWTESLSVSTA